MRKLAVSLLAIIVSVCLYGCESEQWVVTFEEQGETIGTIKVNSSNDGVEVACPDNIEKDGYVLAGWETNESSEKAHVYQNSLDEWYIRVFTDNVIATPIWKKACKVVIEDGFGKELSSFVVAEGAPYYGMQMELSLDGYSFEGWEPEIETVTGDVTIVAQWKKKGESKKETSKKQSDDLVNEGEDLQLGSNSSHENTSSESTAATGGSEVVEYCDKMKSCFNRLVDAMDAAHDAEAAGDVVAAEVAKEKSDDAYFEVLGTTAPAGAEDVDCRMRQFAASANLLVAFYEDATNANKEGDIDRYIEDMSEIEDVINEVSSDSENLSEAIKDLEAKYK